MVEVTAEGVSIRGANYTATALGTATLLQASRRTRGQLTLPLMTVRDRPHRRMAAR